MHRDIFSLIEHQAVHEIVGTGIIHENAVLLVSDTMMNCNGKERERTANTFCKYENNFAVLCI